MFGRSNWAIFGLAKESLDGFKAHLEDAPKMLSVSQSAAAAVTGHKTVDTLGINPFHAPRLDEQQPFSLDQERELVPYATADQSARTALSLSSEILQNESFAAGLQSFQIHPSLPWFGLWAVANQWRDVSDLASVREHYSYTALERPYKFLQATDKRTVDKETRGATAAVRKQFPVLLDFNEGRLYIENSNKKTLYLAKELLKSLGADIVAVGWNFQRGGWPSEILNRLLEKTHYLADFQKRADETTRFRAKEIEKLDDRELEKVVSRYFSMSQLANELWLGISSPAQVRLHLTSPALAVKAPASATTLLKMTDDARIVSGAVTFQDRITAMSKKGGEITFRKDLFKLDVSDQINLTDAGAAMLRGFDLPAFRKDLQREIWQTKDVPTLDRFWSQWLLEMSNAIRTVESSFRELLDLDGSEAAGILPMHAVSEELPELQPA